MIFPLGVLKIYQTYMGIILKLMDGEIWQRFSGKLLNICFNRH